MHFLMRRNVLPYHGGIRDLQGLIALQVQQILSIHDRVRNIQANSDIAVRQNGAVFDHGAEIDFAIALDVAAACDQAAVADLRISPNKCRSVDLRASMHLRAFAKPHAGPDFGTDRAKLAIGR